MLAIKNVCRTNVVQQNISFVFSDVACCCFRLTTFPNFVVFAPAQWDSDFPQLSTLPFIYFQLVLVRFQEFKCKAKSENSNSVAIDLQKLKDVLQNDTKYYIL